MPNIFKDGGGAGIGSYVVVFKDGQLAANTDLLRLRGAYESGEQIYFSIDDAETKDALVPASGWIDEELKLHLVARDFDDNKTYAVSLGDGATESEISVEVEVKDGIEAGGEPLGGGSVEIAGNSLVIPEQPAPEPVISIDGVAYFHKQEFDLEAIYDAGQTIILDVLTGQEKEQVYPYIKGATGMPSGYYIKLVMAVGQGGNIHGEWGIGGDYVNFTSRAFTVVDTQEEVTDDTKICLPTCSAYYGFLSQDGKTFISYYNLKNEGGVPEYIDSVKQGNTTTPIKDVRLPDATAADVGKILAVNDQGELVLQTPSTPSGGTQLYKHRLVGATFYQGYELYIVSADSTPIESAADLRVASQSCLSAYGLQDGGTYPVSIIKIVYASGAFMIFYGLSQQPDDSILFNYDYLDLSEFSDTVTGL